MVRRTNASDCRWKKIIAGDVTWLLQVGAFGHLIEQIEVVCWSIYINKGRLSAKPPLRSCNTISSPQHETCWFSDLNIGAISSKLLVCSVISLPVVCTSRKELGHKNASSMEACALFIKANSTCFMSKPSLNWCHTGLNLDPSTYKGSTSATSNNTTQKPVLQHVETTD